MKTFQLTGGGRKCKAREGEGVKAKQDYCTTNERPYSPRARV